MIDRIAKGILHNGINFRNSDNIIQVGKDGQPTEKDVDTFIIKFADMVHKEIGGSYYSSGEDSAISHISIGAYNNNTSHRTNNHGLRILGLTFGPTFSTGVRAIFHTHPLDYSFTAEQRRSPSDGDILFKRGQLKNYPWLKFYILTEPEYGYNYKNEF